MLDIRETRKKNNLRRKLENTENKLQELSQDQMMKSVIAVMNCQTEI